MVGHRHVVIKLVVGATPKISNGHYESDATAVDSPNSSNRGTK